MPATKPASRAVPRKAVRPRRGARPHGAGASRVETAYRRLFEAIESGDIASGSRLREIELSRWLGISRTPVRAALGRLEGEGLVARDASRGLGVACLDQGMVAELYDMREVLEATAAGFAARHASEAEIDALREIAQRDRLADGDPVRLARSNRHFHEAMFRCAHNRYLMRAINALRLSMVLLGPTTLAAPGRPETARLEHQAIIDAIARRDAEGAAAAARAHIRAAYRVRLGQMLEG